MYVLCKQLPEECSKFNFAFWNFLEFFKTKLLIHSCLSSQMQNLWLWRADYIRWLSVRTLSQVSFQSVFDFRGMLEFYFCCCWYGVLERRDRKRVSFSYFEQLTNYLREEQCSKMRVTRSLWWLESYFDGENYSRKKNSIFFFRAWNQKTKSCCGDKELGQRVLYEWEQSTIELNIQMYSLVLEALNHICTSVSRQRF